MSEQKELMIETLDTAMEYMLKLIKAIDMYNGYIHENKLKEGMNLFSYIVEGLEWLTNALMFTGPIQNNSINIEKLRETFPKLLNKFENENYMSVSDILQYEIKPLLQKWSNRLN